MQRGDSATDEISPNHLKGEPGHGEAMDPGGGDREFLVVGVEVAPVPAAGRRDLTNSAELLRILLLNPAPPAPLFVPLVLLGTLRIRALAKALGIQVTQPEMAPPNWMRGTK